VQITFNSVPFCLVDVRMERGNDLECKASGAAPFLADFGRVYDHQTVMNIVASIFVCVTQRSL